MNFSGSLLTTPPSCSGSGIQLRATPRRSARLWISTVTAILLTIASISGEAQSSSAAISGTVTDSSGAVIPDADVLLTNADNHAQQKTSSGSEGTYSIINIRPGNYSVRVSKATFATLEKTGIVLQVNQTATLDFNLAPGSAQQTVTVSSELSPVESSTAELGTVITSKPVIDLPLNGRNFTQLLTLTPGVSPGAIHARYLL